MSADGPEAFFASVVPETLGNDMGPDAYFATESAVTLDHHHPYHHVDTNEPMDEDIFDDEDGEVEELDAEDRALMEELFKSFPELSLDENAVPLEGFKNKWRRFKKAVSGGVKSYVKEGKAQRAKKAATLPTPTKTETATPDLAKKPAEPPVAKPAPLNEPKGKAKSLDLPIGARILVDALAKLVHEDIHASLADLSSEILKSETGRPDAYFANLALASATATLRLGTEASLGAGGMGKVVQQARRSTAKKTPLDTRTITHLKNALTVFCTEMNTLCSTPGCNALDRASDQGAAMGQELLVRMGKTYLPSGTPTLSETNPMVRMSALLTSLLGITQAQCTSQSEINAFVHSSIDPVWSAALTATNMKATIIGQFK